MPEPPNIRLWLRFSEIFLSSYDVDREGLFTEVFKPHTNTKVNVTSILAESLLAPRENRRMLVRTLDGLLS